MDAHLHPLRLIRRLPALLLTAGLAGALSVSLATPATAAVDKKLQTKLGSVLKDSRSRTESAVAVLDAGSGELLYSRGGTRSLIPASNTKVLTAVTAMHVLKPGYRFSTEVIRRGRVTGGVLDGQLYLKGYGDPTARQSDYASLARQVKAAGITRVSGRIVADGSFFDAKRYNPGWSTSYASEYYAAQIAALTVAPNADYDTGTVIVRYKAAGKGRKAKITTTPAAAAKYVKIVNKTTTGSASSSTTFSARRGAGSNTITVRGRVRGGASGSTLVTVDKPELYAAAVFRAELAKVKVTVVGASKIGTTPATKRTRLARDTSMPLSKLLVPFLKLSNNMHAEALTKAMGTRKGRPGSWADGLSYTKGYLKQLGVPMKGVSLTDGSGLTRRNHITPVALATTLQKVRSESWWPAFDAALPVAGNNTHLTGGTLRHRMNGTRAANNAHAKTGTLTGVTALSGYVTGRDGRKYVFSMISNYAGSSPRPVENTLVVTLAGWRR